MKERNKYQDIFPSQDLVIQTKYCKMILCGGRVCLTEQQNPGIKMLKAVMVIIIIITNILIITTRPKSAYSL